ncbi:DUF1292 domain-containing protein [Cellulosilyticum sp. I15G10I2]|uniref:DUF1292 domain-containing protein n=1 Tax=Cellulosilyticum sp. I15G10I2 TaxID=1892843 RepID=UPI00085C86ED|nr:DUF1292 domain-containing protein [Cellulosilyticum sp. I15G10I2]
MEQIKFFDETTGEETLFEVLDEIVLENKKYILVVDQEDVATILKEVSELDEDITYQLLEDENEFKKAAVEFMTNDDYDIEI